MGLLDKLTKPGQGSNLSQFDGATPPDMPGIDPQSTLHYEYSINGNPFMQKKPPSSTLDLEGATPSQYLNNLPE